MIQIINDDCLNALKDMPDNSVDLILTDPPYNISKDDWDKFKTQEQYIEFMGNVFKHCERILKKNGSFYFFHNNFLQIVNLQNFINKETKFIFKQLIIWNKRFEKANNIGFLNGFIEVNALRNYQKMAEYILYYTFQDKTGLTTIKTDINNFSELRNYFKNLQIFINLNKKEIIEIIGQKADHCFRWKSSQWDLPTLETYNDLIKQFNINNWINFKEYETLRQEYETMRYTFNNLKTHHSVWNYEIAEKKYNHLTPKPIDLLENIIKHSSNQNDIVLDCFMGSGSTGVACINTNRNFIGIELDKDYYNIAKQRINEANN
jgi:site-specific DNA-methyltransferase (adenine-specific)